MGILYSTNQPTNQPTMYLVVEAPTERATHVPPTSECGPELKIRGSPPNLFFLSQSGTQRCCQKSTLVHTPFHGICEELLEILLFWINSTDLLQICCIFPVGFLSSSQTTCVSLPPVWPFPSYHNQTCKAETIVCVRKCVRKCLHLIYRCPDLAHFI